MGFVSAVSAGAHRLRRRASCQSLQAAASATAKPRTGKFTLMALGDNRLSEFEPLTQRYDLLIASHSVGADVIAAFRQRNPGARGACAYIGTPPRM